MNIFSITYWILVIYIFIRTAERCARARMVRVRAAVAAARRAAARCRRTLRRQRVERERHLASRV